MGTGAICLVGNRTRERRVLDIEGEDKHILARRDVRADLDGQPREAPCPSVRLRRRHRGIISARPASVHSP